MSDNNINGSDEEMKKRLLAAGKLVEADAKQKRERSVKGSHLTQALTDKAKAAGLVTEDKSGFLKILKAKGGPTVYVAHKGGRVDLSGFTFEHEAVRQISEEHAKEKHLGKVRGTLDFDKSDDLVLAAFDMALETLSAYQPPPPKAIKAPAPKPSEETAAAEESEAEATDSAAN